MRRNGYAIHRCEACDLEFVHPMPDDATLAAVYGSHYFEGDGLGYRDYFGAEREVADAKARARVPLLTELGAKPGGRWLDVGCADGRFVCEALRRGFDAWGMERSPEARAMAKEEPTLVGRVLDSLDDALAHNPFDVVTAWDVIEHLPSPIGTLEALRPHLASGALVGVVVPIIDNVTARRWPENWDQYKPPEHLWYFSRNSLEKALVRTLGGKVVCSKSAWRREARWSGVGRSWAPWLQQTEALAWRAAVRAGVLDERALDDSWLVVVRVP
jgi:SAM-dependent methyltransferase